MKTPDFMSYDRYKKNKKKEKSKSGLVVAVTGFFVALLVFTAIAKSLSPDVDVTIGDDSQTDAKETGLGVKRFIDDRLKMIQMEDDSAGVSKKLDEETHIIKGDESFNDYTKELEEKINLPSKKDKSNMQEVELVQDEPMSSAHTPPRPSSKDLSTPYETPKMSKVLVGRYSTIEQAKVAQEILMDSGIEITPFIKNTGSGYTLQVGSYSSRAKAEGLASELQQNGFPARIIQE